MEFEIENAALNTAHRLKLAAEIAEAWVAGEFKTVTRSEAWKLGWDADSDNPKVWAGENGACAIATADETEIEFSDDFGDAWSLNPTTGILRRG